eukprot:g4203.t1
MIDNILNWLTSVPENDASLSFQNFPSLDALPEDVYNYVLDEVFNSSQPEDQLNLLLVNRVWNQRGHEAELNFRPKTFLPVALKQSFPNVKSLDLSRVNTIKNENLLSLLALKKLRSLKLKRCREITDDGLEHLKELHSLQCLNLARCRLVGDSGLILLSKRLTNLIRLNVKYCYGLTSMGLSEISTLRKLKELNCSGCCGLRSDALFFIGQVSTLQILKLNYSDSLLTNVQFCKSNEVIMGLAQHLNGLRRLDMNLELDLNQTGFAELESLVHLESLRLSGKQLTSKGILTSVGSLQKLKSLWISDSCLSSPLDALTQIQTLTIRVEEQRNLPYPDENLNSISTLIRLRNLSLSGLVDVTGQTVTGLTNLEQLQLIHCPQLHSENLHGLSTLQSLKILAIAHADRLDDAFCLNLKSLRNLRELHITECALLTGSHFGKLSEIQCLEIFVVQFCNGLTDFVFKQMNQLKSLRRLEITMCPVLTEDGVATLANGQLQKLEYLGFSGGRETRLNDAFFKAKLPRFKKYFRGSINITIGDPL